MADTDKSMSPIPITIVMPKAIIMMYEDCLSTIIKLPTVKKFGEQIDRKTQRTITANNTPLPFKKLSFPIIASSCCHVS
jgi:hypothetical protein